MKNLKGKVLCWISNAIYPKNLCIHQSWDEKFLAVGLTAVSFKASVLVKCLGKILQMQDRGMVLTHAPRSTFTWRGLLPCLVIIWSVVWKDVVPLVAVSLIKLVSMLDKVFISVKWLTWLHVLMLVAVSRLSPLPDSVFCVCWSVGVPVAAGS